MTLLFEVLSAIWSNNIARIAVIGCGLFIWGVFKGWAWASADNDAAIREAITARDVYWQEMINKANTEHDQELKNAIAAANAIVPARTNDDLRRLCADPARGADCRDKKSNGVQGVQSPDVERGRQH